MRCVLPAVLLIVACTVAVAAEGAPRAFPGAEGFGATSLGGRGGRVIRVTTLAATGPGSLNEAVTTPGPRIVVFDVSGIIRGDVEITHPRLTIAGQTAPGAGITLVGMLRNRYRIKPPLHDVTIRFLRVRPPRHPRKWAGGDCLQLSEIDRLIVDHVSCSWGSDENVDLCSSRNLTVQWCTIEESDPTGHRKGPHNFGMIMGYKGKDATLHHNLFAHHRRRAPLNGLEILDQRNNVIYNMHDPLTFHPPSRNWQRPGKPWRMNLVANVFIDGPDTRGHREKNSDLDRMLYRRDHADLFEAGNLLAWRGRVVRSRAEPRAQKPWAAPTVKTHSAGDAYRLVLAHAGCLPRDVVSKRMINEVKKRAGRWGRHDPPGGLMAGLSPGKPPTDSDGDGMPDAWERTYELDPNDPADASRTVPAGASPGNRHQGYAWIEYYINERADELIAAAAPMLRTDRHPRPGRRERRGEHQPGRFRLAGSPSPPQRSPSQAPHRAGPGYP